MQGSLAILEAAFRHSGLRPDAAPWARATFFRGRARTKHHERFADVLHRRRFQPLADDIEDGLPLDAVGTREAYLDQLVSMEVAVDLLQGRFAEAFVAEQDDGVQLVGARLERGALGGR
jgi:hypothetical protein